MKPLSFLVSPFAVLLLLLLLFFFWPSSAQNKHRDFLQCLSNKSNDVLEAIHTQNDSSFSSILNSSIQNRRFSTPETPKPFTIITPLKVSHVRATIKCSTRHGVRILTRSGGHDYEGLSYVSRVEPFVVIDMRNLANISLDTENQTAWVQSGATVGQLYNEIAKKSETLAFPAGVYPTVGIGGHFSGGGYGTLLRKYGLAVDNIIDAYMIDVRGRLLDREAMGEDLFWAIRGGGGASFGIIISWKIALVPVPETVTIFNVKKTIEQDAIRIIHRWQYIADKFPKDLFLRIVLKRSLAGLLQATFPSLFLGTANELIPLMEEKFPELGLTKDDCIETSWIKSVLYFSGFSITEPTDVLARRTTDTRSFKGKSDYVQDPMPESAIREIWRKFEKPEAKLAKFILTPFGGKMRDVSESDTPFPHRGRTIYEIQHLVYWKEEDNNQSGEYMKWVEDLYDFATPYVPSRPRAAYYNFRDLDLGRNNEGRTSIETARVWGLKYFGNNFERLVRVKTMVDPKDFFRNEQSIPSLYFLEDV